MTGPKGDTGAPGSAVAYAHINADGSVDAANSKNIAPGKVTRRSTAAYCFATPTFTYHNAVVSPDYPAAIVAPGASVEVGQPGHIATDCISGEPIEVRTFNAGANVFEPHSFEIVFN